MKNMIRGSVLSLLLVTACMARGGVPSLKVTVFDAGGKTTFKGATNAKGAFATANLKPGNYVVQFNSTGGGMKGNQYAIVVSAGMKKVAAAAVPGEKFAGGGVAMRVVVDAGLNITGQVAEEGSAEAARAKKADDQGIQNVKKIQEHMDNNMTKFPDFSQRR